MTAREMFESLGYKYCKFYDRNKIIEYYNEEEDVRFLFWIAEQEFSVSEYGELKNITVDEFKAIQKTNGRIGVDLSDNKARIYRSFRTHESIILQF